MRVLGPILVAMARVVAALVMAMLSILAVAGAIAALVSAFVMAVRSILPVPGAVSAFGGEGREGHAETGDH